MTSDYFLEFIIPLVPITAVKSNTNFTCIGTIKYLYNLLGTLLFQAIFYSI